MKQAMPAGPWRASGCAKTSATSAPTALAIHCLSPVSRQPPSTLRAAMAMAVKSLPAPSSDMAVQPISSPRSIAGMQRSRASALPLSAMRRMALWWLMKAKAKAKSTRASASAAAARTG